MTDTPLRLFHKRMEDRLLRLAAALEDPPDYYGGESSPLLLKPRKVLLFTRRPGRGVGRTFLHGRFNLILGLKGVLRLRLDGRYKELAAGEALLLFPYQNHYYVEEDREDFLFLYAGFEMERREALGALKNRSIPGDALVFRLAERLFSAEAPLRQSLLASILLLLREAPAETPAEAGELPEDELIPRVQELVTANMATALTGEQMADRLGVSLSRLNKSFRKAIGIGPGRFSREIRITHACSLLESREKSVGETAAACGFDSIYSFSRSFKNLIGVSPREFLRRKEAFNPGGESPLPSAPKPRSDL